MTRTNTVEQIGHQERLFLGTVAAVQPGAVVAMKAQSAARKASARLPMVDIGRSGPNDVNSTPENSEIHRIDPPALAIRTFETTHGRLDLMKLPKQNSMELEFMTPCHLVILLTDGLSRGCEWSDGRQTRRSSFLAPNAVLFNPALSYLRIRAMTPQNDCHMMMLGIQPALMEWHDDPEVDLAAVQFRQEVGLHDVQVSQTLSALQQELERPAVNGAFYVDALLFLLLTRLMRCASNLVETSKPTYAKGGLPSWRLKRAIEILEGDLAQMPTVAEVAQLIGLHPTSFCRGFKHSTGLSPHRYILAHRINRAKEMMNDQRLSLTEIALDCGFSGSSQFSVVFKRITGMSPREYRRAL